eukprot:TRINITY_DN8665_c0_g1_i1.p1 TRINITY_DN8665_c0_g1~~TRINITY_DN8665_c0_g1_i1.p1  ORF type:complete len:342 (+),score=56.27 TRINITY_DN8665_c0_g1_i1:105-1130(+)
MDALRLTKEDFLACCGSTKFATEMAKNAETYTLSQAVQTSRDVWFNKVDVTGWLEAFAAHPQIGDRDYRNKNETSKEWSKAEQSTAMQAATDSALQDLAKCNKMYKEKFGFIFLICASGKSTSEILDALKVRLQNRPIAELEIAAFEQQKITELRLAKLFTERSQNRNITESEVVEPSESVAQRLNQIGAHFVGSLSTDRVERVRPPITTHVLDAASGKPAAGVEIFLELWSGPETTATSFLTCRDSKMWTLLGSSSTNSDGRCGSLMPIVNLVPPGMYRITFNTGKYYAENGVAMPHAESKFGFYPYISLVFEIKPSQTHEHFHVPVLLSPFAFSTYRGS